MAHPVQRQQHILDGVLDTIVRAVLAADDGADEGQYVAQQALVSGAIARLRRRHQP